MVKIKWKSIGQRILEWLLSVWKGFVGGLKHLPYAFYIQVHPFDGFFRLKNEQSRRSIPCAVILYAMLAISSILKRQLTGYLFADTAAQLQLNILSEIIAALLPYMLWVVANWCFTSLMDGDGKLSDIFCATAVATIPIMVCNLIQIPVSQFSSLQEENLYVFIGGLGIVYTYWMMFFGMMITHQYTVFKSIITTLLTIVGMLVIAFIIILIFFLIQQVLGFATSLGSEISFRLNE